MANPARGVELWSDITATLNEIIETTGKKIDINNTKIWKEYLHTWDNNDWQDIFSAVEAVLFQRPDIFKKYHIKNYEEALMVLKLGLGLSDRVLDKKQNKKHAWAMIMTLREVLNTLNGVDLPNDDKPRRSKPKVTVENLSDRTVITVFHDLFDIED